MGTPGGGNGMRGFGVEVTSLRGGAEERPSPSHDYNIFFLVYFSPEN